MDRVMTAMKTIWVLQLQISETFEKVLKTQRIQKHRLSVRSWETDSLDGITHNSIRLILRGLTLEWSNSQR